MFFTFPGVENFPIPQCLSEFSIPTHRSNIRNYISRTFCFELSLFIDWEVAGFPLSVLDLHKKTQIDEYLLCWVLSDYLYFSFCWQIIQIPLNPFWCVSFLIWCEGCVMHPLSLTCMCDMTYVLKPSAISSYFLFFCRNIYWVNKNLANNKIMSIREFYQTEVSLSAVYFEHGWDVPLLFYYVIDTVCL